MDRIQIRGLKAETVIGVHEWERKLPRPVVVDVELPTDAARGAASDRLADALDYHAIGAAITTFVGAARVQLIETLAEQLAAELMRQFALPWISLTVHKPGAVAGAQDVSVSIQRGVRVKAAP
jgi:7,8-dihydroneopterin aldolase/epimerase/oxygenase